VRRASGHGWPERQAKREPIRAVSLADDLLFNLGFLLPTAALGAFTRSRAAAGLLTRLPLDWAAQRFVRRARRHGGGDYLWIHLAGARALLVLDPEGIARVLERSPLEFADGRAKREGMARFQPGAVTISRGEDWRMRRRFNESVLATGKTHPDARGFLAIIRQEVDRARRSGGELDRWSRFEQLFRRLTLRVVLGLEPDQESDALDHLRAIMRESNRPAFLRPRRSRHLDSLQALLRRDLEEPRAPSLASRCARASSTRRTRVESQVTHWLFATWETLAINAVRALALIAAHPRVEAGVREELAALDPADPDDVARLLLLEGCVQEAMRLWPTTPMLVREAAKDTTLGGERVARHTQIVILTAFHHRDPERDPAAGEFRPEAWANGPPPPPLLFFGGGAQACAGRDLALLVAKGVLAALVGDRRHRLLTPSLAPGRPIPLTCDHFRVRFAVDRR
jgi:cytochrome P450